MTPNTLPSEDIPSAAQVIGDGIEFAGQTYDHNAGRIKRRFMLRVSHGRINVARQLDGKWDNRGLPVRGEEYDALVKAAVQLDRQRYEEVMCPAGRCVEGQLTNNLGERGYGTCPSCLGSGKLYRLREQQP